MGLLLVMSFSIQAQSVVIDKIIAKVDNHYILKSELEAQYQQYLQSGQGNTPTRCQLLESLIIGKVMLAKAEIDSVLIDDKKVEMELSSRMDQMEQQFGSQKNIVEAYGKTIASLKDELRSAIKEQLTTRKMQEKSQAM
jgi:peptidyl-prolyl cis-trans isomerase SurA